MARVENAEVKARLLEMRTRFAEQFEVVKRGKERIFKRSDGVYFKVSALYYWNALVIEYSENEKMARAGILGEDGDLFYPEDMDADEMFEAMLHEVKDAYN